MNQTFDEIYDMHKGLTPATLTARVPKRAPAATPPRKPPEETSDEMVMKAWLLANFIAFFYNAAIFCFRAAIAIMVAGVTGSAIAGFAVFPLFWIKDRVDFYFQLKNSNK